MNLKDSELSNILRQRATDVWRSQGTAAGAMDISLPMASDETFTNDHPSGNKMAIAINALGSALDLGHMPDVLGKELQRVLSLIGCSAQLSVKNSTADQSKASIDLGLVDGKRVVL